MAVPTLKVEIAFGVGAHATDAEIAASAIGWADVTDHVQEVSIHRGRDGDWEESFVSTASIVLTNNDRKFDPFNVASPYFNKLNPRKQIKITGTIGATVYPIFRGYVNGFPVKWQDGGKMSTITVEAFDVLALLSSNELKGDLAEIYTRSLSPVHYYRMSDPTGTTTITDIGSGNKTWTYTNSTSAATTVPTSRQNLGIGLSGTSTDWQLGLFQQTNTSSPSTTGDITVSMWTMTGSSKSRYLFVGYPQDQNNTVAGVINANGKVIFGYNVGASGGLVESKGTGYDGAVPHHYLFTYKKSTGEGRIYIDGIDQTLASSLYSGINYFPLSQFRVYDGVYQEIAVFDKVLTGTEITNLYSFGAGNQTEATNTRLLRLLALTDLPSEKYTSGIHTTATANISGVPFPNAPVIETLTQAQKTEGGWLFVQKNGVLKSTEREYFASKTSQATFIDDGTAFGYSGDIDVYYDGDNLRNDVVVKFGGNSSSLASGLFDPDSITNNGRHTLTVDSQCSTATEATNLAKFWLRYGIINPPIITPFEVGLSATTAQWQTLLGLELLDRITFKRTPRAGSPFNKQLLINNIDFNLKPNIWSMKIGGSSRFTSVFTTREASGTSTSGQTTSSVVFDTPEIQSITSAYTYDTAVMSCQVNAKGYSTSVKLQYGTDSGFGTYTEVLPTPSTVTGSSFTACSKTVTGLTAGTTYYYRFVATSSVNTTIGSGGSFTTYNLKLVAFSSSGTWTAPTWGGTTMTSAFYAQLIGGGGSAPLQGGGGGGGGQAYQLNVTLSSSMVGVVGGEGGNSTLTNVSSTAFAGGSGSSGDFMTIPDGGDNGDGTYSGGTGYYASFTGVSAGGGGAGAGGAGGNYRTVSGNPVGGHGGTSGTTAYYTISYGGGGGGHGNYGRGNSVTSSFGYGDGGSYGIRNGGGGRIWFAYYGPGGSRSGTGWTEGDF